jgi:hypothetical protein
MEKRRKNWALDDFRWFLSNIAKGMFRSPERKQEVLQEILLEKFENPRTDFRRTAFQVLLSTLIAIPPAVTVSTINYPSVNVWWRWGYWQLSVIISIGLYIIAGYTTPGIRSAKKLLCAVGRISLASIRLPDHFWTDHESDHPSFILSIDLLVSHSSCFAL